MLHTKPIPLDKKFLPLIISTGGINLFFGNQRSGGSGFGFGLGGGL